MKNFRQVLILAFFSTLALSGASLADCSLADRRCRQQCRTDDCEKACATGRRACASEGCAGFKSACLRYCWNNVPNPEQSDCENGCSLGANGCD